MRYEQIDSTLFRENRRRFTAEMKPNSLAVFHSNDIMPTSADGTMPFIQQTDVLYLSGVDQEETIVVLFPDAPDTPLGTSVKEVLFIRETSEEIAIWEGNKLTKEQAREVSGIETVFWTHEFERVFPGLMRAAENVYLNLNEHYRFGNPVQTQNRRFHDQCREQYPLHNYERTFKIMERLRPVKHSLEIELLQKACDITKQGFLRILNFVKPGVKEFEIEAEILHEFMINRSRRFAYTPIIASGANACALHYIENNDTCQEGDVLLMDFGAEYANYAADLSRSIPVSGRYTDRQRKIYDAVLGVQRSCYEILRPGTTLNEYHREVGELMTKALLDVGLLSKHDVEKQSASSPAYKKYFMHGTSHFLGLDVHDYGDLNTTIQPGMVFTVEPGIYIREEGLGIRIENDVVVTEDGIHDLMAEIPVEAEHIEELMNA